MKAITIKQPWASMIANGLKSIETRSHTRFKNLLGRRVAIHAGLATDKNFWSYERFFPEEKKHLISKVWSEESEQMAGMVLATAKVYDIKKLSYQHNRFALTDCGMHRELTGLFLTEIYKLQHPIFMRGKLGLWDFELNRLNIEDRRALGYEFQEVY